MELVLIQILNGLQYGLLIFLAASGLTLVFGILGIINLSHGSFYMLGAYLSLTLTSYTGDIFLALLLGIPLAFAFGALIEWLFIRHLYGRDHLQQVLLTFALILIFNDMQRVVWGTRPHSVPIPSYLSASVQLSDVLSYPVYRLAVAGFCVFLALCMVYVIQYTRIGQMIRAGESNREMVEVLGIDFAAVVSLRVRRWRRPRSRGRRDRGADRQRLSRHRRAGPHHFLCRRRDWRDRQYQRSVFRRAADRACRCVRQGFPSRICERRGVCPDGGRADRQSGRLVRAGLTC